MALERLLDESWSYRASRALQVANKLDICTRLTGRSATAEEIAVECRTKPDMTEKLLIVCTAMGLLSRKDGRYANTELAEKHLVRGREGYQGDLIAHSSHVWDFWHNLPNDIYEGEPPQENEQQTHRDFILAMHNIAKAGRADRVTDAVDLAGCKNLLDVGGGPGTYSIEFCRKNPGLQATVFDVPDTIAIAREVIEHEGVQDRVKVHEGDWNVNDFGEGYDVILMSNILHGTRSKSGMKLSKAYNAMMPGGLLIVQDFVLNIEKDGPLTPALFNMMVGAYSKDELFAEIERAGFADAKVVLPQENAEPEDNTVVTAVRR